MCVASLYLLAALTNGSDVQSMDTVCSSNSPAPFQASQYPNGGVLRDGYGSIRLGPGHAHFWRQKNATRAFAPLQTEPNRTLRWNRVCLSTRVLICSIHQGGRPMCVHHGANMRRHEAPHVGGQTHTGLPVCRCGWMAQQPV